MSYSSFNIDMQQVTKVFLFVMQGLYPETHGIVDNKMFDPAINETFDIFSETRFNSDWWKGEPVSSICNKF